MTDIERLRDEHAAVGIGPELAALLERVVRATAPVYPPADYSASGTWDRASLEDVLQDWALSRLVARRDLTVMLASAGSVPALRSMLTRSIGQHLTNSRRRTSATNLYKRSVATLRTDGAFVNVVASNRSGDEGWSLAAQPLTEPATAPSVSALLKTAWSKKDADLGVVRYGPYSLKSSPVLRGPALVRFLADLLDAADGYLTASQLFDVMRLRFNLIRPAQTDLDESLPAADVDVPAAAEARSLARGVVARMSRRDGLLVRALDAHDGDASAASAGSGAAVSDVIAALESLHALIAEDAASFDEALAVHRLVLESLYQQGEDL